MSRLSYDIIIQAQDKISNTLKQVNNKLEELQQQGKNAFNTKDLRAYQTQLKRIESEAKALASIFKTYSQSATTADKQRAQQNINNSKIQQQQEKTVHQQRMNSLKEVMAEDKRAHQQRMSDLREEEENKHK